MFENVTKRFGKVAFVQNLTLSIKQGERVSLIANEGQGKTTLLKLIAGLEEPDEGRIVFDGIDSKRIPIEKRKISFLLEKPLFFENKTVQKNFEFAFAAAGRNKTLSVEFLKLLEKHDLTKFLKVKVKKLSRFEKVLLSVIRAVIKTPEIILIDNVTNFLKEEQKGLVLKLIRELFYKTNATIIFCTNPQNFCEIKKFSCVFLNFGTFFSKKRINWWKNNILNKLIFDTFFEAKIQKFGKLEIDGNKLFFRNENERFELQPKFALGFDFSNIEFLDCVLIEGFQEKVLHGCEGRRIPLESSESFVFDALDGNRII